MIEAKLRATKKEREKAKKDRCRSLDKLRFERKTEVEILQAELKSIKERLELEQEEHRNAVTSMSQELTRCHEELRKTIKDSAEAHCEKKNLKDNVETKMSEKDGQIRGYKRQLSVATQDLKKCKDELAETNQELS